MKTLALVPVDLGKLSGVVKNNVAKKTVHEKLVAKENNIDSGLVKKLDYNANVTEIENKIPTISGLATNAALTAVENTYLISVF